MRFTDQYCKKLGSGTEEEDVGSLRDSAVSIGVRLLKEYMGWVKEIEEIEDTDSDRLLNKMRALELAQVRLEDFELSNDELNRFLSRLADSKGREWQNIFGTAVMNQVAESPVEVTADVEDLEGSGSLGFCNYEDAVFYGDNESKILSGMTGGEVEVRGEYTEVAPKMVGGRVYIRKGAISAGAEMGGGDIYVEGEIEAIGADIADHSTNLVCSANVYNWQDGEWIQLRGGED